MSRKSRRKPHDPAEAEAKRLARLEREAEKRRLVRQGAEVNINPQTGDVVGAFKPDALEMMVRADKRLEQSGDAPPRITQEAFDAVRALEAMIAKAEPLRCALASLDRVSGGERRDYAAERYEPVAYLAARRVRMDASTWAMLEELCSGNLLVTRWRGVVARHTGETNDDAQSGALRSAFRVLASVEEAIVRDGQRRAA